MQPTSIILAVALFSAKTFAQAFEEDNSGFLQDPEYSSEVARLSSSVVSQLASAFPTIEKDLFRYVSTLVGGPPFVSVASKLNPILPNDEKSKLASDPTDYVYNLITATTPPVWATDIPSDVESYLQRVGDDVDSIITHAVTIPPLPQPRTTLEPRPGSSNPGFVPISSSIVAVTSTAKFATSTASTVTTAPAGTGVFHSSGSGGAGTGTGRIVTPTSPSNPSVSPFTQNSASRWGGMVGAVAALISVGVGALLLA